MSIRSQSAKELDVPVLQYSSNLSGLSESFVVHKCPVETCSMQLKELGGMRMSGVILTTALLVIYLQCKRMVGLFGE